jgi:ribosomal protein S27E
MKPLYVKCPQCKEVSELFLGSEAYMIVLNCPSCNAALMYYYGKSFEIDESEMEKIQGNLQMTTVQGILKNISAREQGKHAAVAQSVDVSPSHKAGSPVREVQIADDDITNLKIELALSKDVNDFINSL